MYGLLLTILVLDGVFLGIVILLQSGKGGGLAALGGGAAATDGILAGRQATTMLTRATWTAGTIFMVLALVLSIMSSRSALPTSILRDDAGQAAPAPEPILPGVEQVDPEAEVAPPPGNDEGEDPGSGNP